MTDKRASELLSENLTAIYGYAFSKLYDKDKVDELASEIVYEIIVSARNLHNEEAFWGFAWKIAENTFCRFIRRNELAAQTMELTEENIGVYERSPEQEYIQKETESEEIYLLRRELSLLKKTHREVCVAYYVDNKSCSQIAKEHIDKPSDVLSIGQEITAKVVDFDGEAKKISLSVKALQADQEQAQEEETTEE